VEEGTASGVRRRGRGSAWAGLDKAHGEPDGEAARHVEHRSMAHIAKSQVEPRY
jgi:hypothetical protein